MKTSELIASIAKGTPLRQADVALMLTELGKITQAALMAGDDVTLPGIGKIVVVKREAREGMNPATGEKIPIPARRAVKLKPSVEMKASLR